MPNVAMLSVVKLSHEATLDYFATAVNYGRKGTVKMALGAHHVMILLTHLAA
jgi:hypothetical protein